MGEATTGYEQVGFLFEQTDDWDDRPTCSDCSRPGVLRITAVEKDRSIDLCHHHALDMATFTEASE